MTQSMRPGNLPAPRAVLERALGFAGTAATVTLTELRKSHQCVILVRWLPLDFRKLGFRRVDRGAGRPFFSRANTDLPI